MTTKQHLKAFHEAAATHHATMAKSHTKLAGHYAKADLDGQDVSDEHKTMAASHTTMAEHHVQMCKSVGDSMDKAAGDRIVPDRVGSIPTFPVPVPRAGSPNFGSQTRPNVPVEFEKFVTVEDD